jgi:hypothetical protein
MLASFTPSNYHHKGIEEKTNIQKALNNVSTFLDLCRLSQMNPNKIISGIHASKILETTLWVITLTTHLSIQ